MSVISSRVSSVSSILKAPGIRSQLLKSNRVCFKLPKNIKNIIFNFEAGKGIKDYEELITVLKDANLKDSNLVEFLTEARQCVSLLGPSHKMFIEGLLQIKWIERSEEVIEAYKIFLEDLICAQVYHAKYIVDNLIEQFKPREGSNAEWKTGEPKEDDMRKLNHVHDILHKILNVVPMSSKLILQSVRARFPYMAHGAHTHEVYIYALLQILKYAPQLRSDILSLIINRLMVLDVNIPRLNEDVEEDDLMEDNDYNGISDNNDMEMDKEDQENEKSEHPVAHTLDICMEQLLKYVYNACHTNETLVTESLKTLYFDLLKIFETIVLPTHACRYVQYVMFYICSFKTAVAEAFIDWLWKKTSDPNIPIIIRHTSVSYIASLIATASFVSLGLVKTTQSKLAKWIHNYINMQERSDYVSDDPRDHPVFYSICQALFFIVTARYRDFIESKKNMMFLQELNLPKIVTCKLNPLKPCQSDIVYNFAEVTKTYQLVYCYTIIENNARSQLPVIHGDKYADSTLDDYFPFSTYTLRHSGERLSPLFHENVRSNERKSKNRHRTEIVEDMIE